MKCNNLNLARFDVKLFDEDSHGTQFMNQDENGQNKLRREPLTQVEIEEQKLLGEAVTSLEDFKKLFTNENIRRNFPSKYLVRGHPLTNEQLDWLLDNQNRVNTYVIFQYLESTLMPEEQVQKIKKFPNETGKIC